MYMLKIPKAWPHVILGRCAADGEASVQAPLDVSTKPDASAVEQACERMILETVRLLQEGQLEEAEYLLEEGAYPSAPQLTAWPCVVPGWTQLMCPMSLLGGP